MPGLFKNSREAGVTRRKSGSRRGKEVIEDWMVRTSSGLSLTGKGNIEEFSAVQWHHRALKKHTIQLIVLFFIEFIGMTLVNKIIQVSGIQLCITSSVYCIVCSPP